MSAKAGTKNEVLYLRGKYKSPQINGIRIICSHKDGVQVMKDAVKRVHASKQSAPERKKERYDDFKEKAKKEGVKIEDLEETPDGYDFFDLQGVLDDIENGIFSNQNDIDVEVEEKEISGKKVYELKSYAGDLISVWHSIIGDSEAHVHGNIEIAFRWCIDNWDNIKVEDTE